MPDVPSQHAAARSAGFTPVGDVAHALLADAVASSVAHWSAQAARLGDAAAEARLWEAKYRECGHPELVPDADRFAHQAADFERQARDAERHRDALQAHLASLEGSDWPAAELVDGITDDVRAELVSVDDDTSADAAQEAA
jgi:hypothetical protein